MIDVVCNVPPLPSSARTGGIGWVFASVSIREIGRDLSFVTAAGESDG